MAKRKRNEATEVAVADEQTLTVHDAPSDSMVELDRRVLRLLDSMCETVEAKYGFVPTRQQAITRLIIRATQGVL